MLPKFGSVISFYYICIMKVLIIFLFSFIGMTGYGQITKITNQPNWSDSDCIDCKIYACETIELDNGDVDCDLTFLINPTEKYLYFVDNGIVQIVYLKKLDKVLNNYYFIYKTKNYTIYLASLDIGLSVKKGGEIYVYKNEVLIYGNKNILLTF
jgi:hypothetical protein